MSPGKSGGQAFPRPASTASLDDRLAVESQRGMTLRDWFAGQALAGLARGVGLDLDRHVLAQKAFDIADAMLAVRDQ